jgi:KipI family sensor histidine kinase inhibitor
MLRAAGDRGALLDVPEGTAARVARAIAGLPGVTDAVPGHQTVLVTWDDRPPSDLAEVASRAAAMYERGDPRRTAVEIPLVYDGADLHVVAELSGLSVDAVIARHAAAEYTVAFLGFAPGFAYLVGGDRRLHVPRREEPRQRVPAGSVAVAGPYSGVYPREAPGGWRLLGTTELVLFDPGRQPPALLEPGDRVRFVPA